MTGAFWVVVLLASVLCGAVFSTLANAVREASRGALEEVAVIRGRKRRVEPILEDQDGHATAVAMLRVACNLLASVASVFYVATLRGVESPRWPDVGIGLLAAALLVWVFGLAIPQSIARYAAEQTVYAWSGLLRAAYIALAPLRLISRFSDEVVRRLSGKPRESKAEEIETELLSVVEEAQQEGQFDEVEKSMIEAVVRFRNLTAKQVMTPRTEMEALELTDNLGAVTAYIRSCKHSRIPVYEESLDRIIGIFYIKDLLHWLAEGSRGGKPFDLPAILRPALFVPETKPVRELMAELLAKKVHIAIIADEFGGTAGLVTIEDIMEEIVGEIQDEYEQHADQKPEVLVHAASRSAEIDARAYIDDANEALAAINVELPKTEDYETVGGFVTVTLGRIPPVGEVLRHENVVIRVLEAEPTRVARVRLEVADLDEPRPANAEVKAAAE